VESSQEWSYGGNRRIRLTTIAENLSIVHDFQANKFDDLMGNDMMRNDFISTSCEDGYRLDEFSGKVVKKISSLKILC